MRLSVTTPRGALVDTEVDEVTATGELGEFGVLPGHVPLMSALKAGVLWYKGKDHSGVLALGQGFLQWSSMKWPYYGIFIHRPPIFHSSTVSLRPLSTTQ